jgi:hypothetical protein
VGIILTIISPAQVPEGSAFPPKHPAHLTRRLTLALVAGISMTGLLVFVACEQASKRNQ